jgi:phosphoribosylaminoimidazole-succinocarboxamide synthase
MIGDAASEVTCLTSLISSAISYLKHERNKRNTFQFKGQTAFYKGKVRDVYTIQDKYLAMVVTDRISAFDVVLPEPIPYKGQVLNQIAAKFLKATADIVPNWVVTVPDPSVTIGRICEPFKVEMVIRGYLGRPCRPRICIGQTPGLRCYASRRT